MRKQKTKKVIPLEERKEFADSYLYWTSGYTWDELPDVNSLEDYQTLQDIFEACKERRSAAGNPKRQIPNPYADLNNKDHNTDEEIKSTAEDFRESYQDYSKRIPVFLKHLFDLIKNKTNALRILIMIIAFIAAGNVFSKKEYYVFSDYFGYLKVDQDKYVEWKADYKTKDLCKKKKIFNISVGLISAAIVLLLSEFFKKKDDTDLYKPTIEKPSSLQEFAKYYHELGFNIIPIKGDPEGNNVTQDSFKSPYGEWSEYKFNRQPKSYLETIDWEDATGIGAIAGINNLICIDIDGCKKFAIVERIIKSIGLSKSYSWVIRSGSGVGYHIWIKSKNRIDSSSPFFDEPFIKFHPIKKYSNYIKQIELRNFAHVVLPPSVSSIGKTYEFVNMAPTTSPRKIDYEDVIDAIYLFAKA